MEGKVCVREGLRWMKCVEGGQGDCRDTLCTLVKD